MNVKTLPDRSEVRVQQSNYELDSDIGPCQARNLHVYIQIGVLGLEKEDSTHCDLDPILQVLLAAGENPHKVDMSGLTCDGITRVIDMSSTLRRLR